MADMITPEDVQELDFLTQILGFDASNRWGKIPGSKLSDAVLDARTAKTEATAAANQSREASTTADNAVKTAAAAQETANSAKETADAAQVTADGIAATANNALKNANSSLTYAQTAESLALNLAMTGRKTQVVNSVRGVLPVYMGNFVDGMLNPKTVTGEPNAQFGALWLQLDAASSMTALNLLAGNYLSGGLFKGDLIVVAPGMGGFDLQVDGKSGATVGIGNASLIAFRLQLAGPNLFIEPLTGCDVTVTSLPFLTRPSYESGGIPTGAAGGDLSGSYPNPILKSSVDLKGTPTAPTQEDTAMPSRQIATSEYVMMRTGHAIATEVKESSVNWTRDRQLFYITGKNGVTLIVPEGSPDMIGQLSDTVNTAQVMFIPTTSNRFVVAVNIDGETESIVYTGVAPTGMWMANIQVINLSGKRIIKGVINPIY